MIQTSLKHTRCLALCLLENRDHWHDATREAELGVGLAPDSSLSHYVLASVYEKRNRLPEAMQSIDQAIQLAPEQSYFYGLKASIFGQQARWRDALEAASTGLSLNAEEKPVLPSAPLPLSDLAKQKMRFSKQKRAFRNAPILRWPTVHAVGPTPKWSVSRSSRSVSRSALRLGPTNEMARVGMIQALNNNHFFFRMILASIPSLVEWLNGRSGQLSSECSLECDFLERLRCQSTMATLRLTDLGDVPGFLFIELDRRPDVQYLFAVSSFW